MTRGRSPRGFRVRPGTPNGERILLGVACNVTTQCWEWLGYVEPSTGYAHLTIDGRPAIAHRVAYEAFVGPIPAGLQIDHLCRNRLCVNPSHLEPVTALVNTRRSPISNATKMRCPSGHPYSPANTYRCRGRRYCRTCQRSHIAAFRDRQSVAS